MFDTIPIRDAMSREFAGVTEGDSVADALALMREENVGSVVVLHGHDPVGVVTERDLLTVALGDDRAADTSVAAVMTSAPEPLDIDSDLQTGIIRLATDRVVAVPVVDGESVVGVLTPSDVVMAAASVGGRATENTAPAASETNPTPEAVEAGTDINPGVCESCGTLSADLAEVNGQMLCPDCQSVT